MKLHKGTRYYESQTVTHEEIIDQKGLLHQYELLQEITIELVSVFAQYCVSHHLKGERWYSNMELSTIQSDNSRCYADEIPDRGRGVTQTHLSKPDVSSFLERLYLIILMGPCGGGAASWLWDVCQIRGTQEADFLKVREAHGDSVEASPQLTAEIKPGTRPGESQGG